MTQSPSPLGDSAPRTLGPYRLYGVLGGGSLGPVYLGRGNPGRGPRRRTAAVRALRPELLRDRQLRARLRRELPVAPKAAPGAAAPAHLPFVAPVLGFDMDHEQPWLATAFIPGPSLGRLVTHYGPLPEPAVRALGGAIARALAGLHGAGVVHRGLRPGKVLLAADRPQIAGHALGLATGGGDTAAEDVFELAVLLLYATTGAYAARAALPSAGHRSPDLTGVPETLHAVLLSCLHRTPGNRPTAGEVARVLDPEQRAEEPAYTWLPESYLLDIENLERAVRQQIGRRLFGLGRS